MSIGSVSTPTSTSVPNRGQSSKPRPATPTPSDQDDVNVRGTYVTDPEQATQRMRARGITSPLPSLPNAPALAQAVTGRDDLTSVEVADAVMSSMHGDSRFSANRTTRQTRDSAHVGGRDAEIAALRERRQDIVDQAGGGELGSPAAGAVEMLDDQIQTQRGLNAMGDVLHVLGADSDAVDLLEDPDRVRVVADELLAGSAGYDEETDTILVSRSIADQAAKLATRLTARGLLDEDGTYLPGQVDQLDSSGDVDDLVKLGNLIAVHEGLHARQHDEGTLHDTGHEVAEDAHRSVAEWSAGLPVGVPMTPDEAADMWRSSDSAWRVEAGRVDAEEYDAYVAQEHADIQLGAMLKVQLVTDERGAPLPREQAVANIVALERGRALPYGPDRGWMRSESVRSIMDDLGIPIGEVPWHGVEQSATGATIVGEHPGWKRPGWKRPGWKRPGFETS